MFLSFDLRRSGQEDCIRKYVLWPLFAALLFSAAVALLAGYRLNQLHLAWKADQQQAATKILLPYLLEKHTLIPSALLNGLADCLSFRRAWWDEDQKAMLARTERFFDRFEAQYSFPDLSFYRPDGTLLLQLGQVADYGDGGDRALAGALHSGRTVHGLLVDRRGGLILRLARPVKFDGQLAGYVALGLDMRSLATEIGRAMGRDIWFAVFKGQLDREQWRPADWERFVDVVIIGGSRPDLPSALDSLVDRFLQQPDQKIFMATAQGRTTQASQLPLLDIGGREIGKLYLLDDISALAASLNRLHLLFLGILWLTAAVVFVFLYFFLGRIETRLTNSRTALLAEIESRRQTEAELLRLKENLEGLVAERTGELTAANRELQGKIDELEQAEAKLRYAKEEWEQTFNAMDDIVTLQDPELRIVRANRAAGKLLGLEPEQLIGRHCYQLFRNSNQPCDGCPGPKTLQSWQPNAQEIEHRNLSRIFHVSVAPIIGDNGTCRALVHVARDITKQKKTEAQVQQARKMEAIGNLAAGVAHDFNNILTGILGYSELILRGLPADSPLRPEISDIIKMGKQGGNLTRQLLVFSRRQQLERCLVNLNELVANLLKMLSRLLGEDIELEFAPAADLAPIMADPGQMEQLLINLAVNARDAMPAGGVVTIETANVVLDAGYTARFPDMIPGPYVMLVVTDTGTGMDQEVKEHIFEPFFTTKGIGQGTGLGLAIVYGIVQSHHGNIWVYSESGHGAVFKIFLPAEAPGEQQVQQEDDEPPGGRETILLVEDEESVRTILCRSLEKLGYTVLAAAGAVEAEALVADRREAVDLLFTDLIMPGGNGQELHQRLSARWPGLKVLFMSGYSQATMEQKQIDLAGQPFIQKPFTAARVAWAVRRALGDRTP